jgi:crotonobetainyl-CoA:carnitine CoA-transferase CaiB-like acyl-CoA transferase
MAGALSGIRVIEAGTGVGPAYCGRLFAGLGTDVIKLESPEGDPLRREGPFPGDLPDPERSGLFLHLNTGKRSVLSTGPSELSRLLPVADVLILASSPAEIWAAGFSLEALRAEFPALVIVNLGWFGLTGPYADYLGSELVAYAAGGYALLTGDPAREPIKAYGALVEYQAGVHAALGVMAALHARRHTGEGQVVDVSTMEAATFLIGGVEQNAFFHGKVARRNGTRLLGFPPHHSYPSTIRPCKDGYVHCHANNRYLDLLAALIPHPRLTDPEVLETMMGHADEIDAIMDAWLADKTRDDVVRLAQELRLPFTEVMEPGEVMAEAHHRERGSFVTIDHPGAGPVLQPGAPLRMGATPWVDRPAPMLGQHTAEVLAEAASAEVKRAHPTGVRTKPLAGVRVVDFTNAVAGPIASFLLADLGAEVIKIEAPSARPLNAAGTAPLREGAEGHGYDRIMLYNELNHGKRSLSLDVAQPEGAELFLKLVAESDIVVQNFSPRVMGNLGIGYEALRRAKPDIILVSMPAFGLSGPYRDRIAYGPGIDAMSGFSHLTGYADGPPMKPGNFFCDQNAGLHASYATLAALWHRQQTGEGQHVELAMIEGEFQVLGDAYIDFAFNGRERMRTGNDHPSMAPHAVFRCRGNDAWVAITVATDAQFQALCRVIERPALATDARFATVAARHANRALLTEPITAWTALRTHIEAQDVLQAAGVPAGAAMDALELLANPHVRARHGFEYVDTPAVGPTPYPRVAFILSETPTPIDRPAPPFAEANDYVLRDILGLHAEEIAQLEQRKVVSRVPTGGH